MQQQVSANFTLPAVMNSLPSNAQYGVAQSASAKANAANSNDSSSKSSSGSDLSTTFLTLLAQELQNQDPTAPVDPTQMVGQMISLNQLQQLISINQAVTATKTSSPSGSGSGNDSPQKKDATANVSAANATSLPAANGSIRDMTSAWRSAAVTNQLPFDPNTMMPLNSGNSGAAEASFNSVLNPAMMGLSGTNNNTSGGK